MKNTTEQIAIQLQLVDKYSFDQLLHLCQYAALPTLNDTEKLYETVCSNRNRIYSAFIDDVMVGCSCLMFDEVKTYIGKLGLSSFPLPNILLCGSFVHPHYRGLGIGNLLYAKRLYEAVSTGIRPLIVELLGDGVTSSVHTDTLPGYRFHLKNGFSELGFSTDDDAGKILIYPAE